MRTIYGYKYETGRKVSRETGYYGLDVEGTEFRSPSGVRWHWWLSTATGVEIPFGMIPPTAEEIAQLARAFGG